MFCLNSIVMLLRVLVLLLYFGSVFTATEGCTMKLVGRSRAFFSWLANPKTPIREDRCHNSGYQPSLLIIIIIAKSNTVRLIPNKAIEECWQKIAICVNS